MENAEKGKLDHQHHTSKETAKKTEGDQEWTSREGEEEYLTGRETAGVEDEEDESESREEGGESPTMACCQQLGRVPNMQEQSPEDCFVIKTNCQPCQEHPQNTHGNTWKHHWTNTPKWM